jgi:hypothetical protein
MSDEKEKKVDEYEGKRKIEFFPSRKQYEAYQLLSDKTHTQIGYGGAASGGKSYLGCFWITANCLAYPGTGWLLGRRDLVNLRRTTLLTLFKLWADIGIDKSEYNYNQQNNIITFTNGSQIFLFDLAHQPSDPLFTRLGGLELTGAFIDEANEVDESAINIIVTRLGRRKNKEFNLTPKLLECFNPDKGHIYQRYYKCWKEGQLPAYRAFIKALPTDNPHTTQDYINQLKSADKITRERLLLGNFEYDDDPGTLVRYDAIMDLFTNTVSSGEKYITADIARFGADQTVLMVWEGLKCYIIEVYEGLATDTVAQKISLLAQIERVPYSHILIDETGVGGGVVDMLRGTKGFIAAARPLNNPLTHKQEPYANLKTQCIYRMGGLISDHKVAVRVENERGEDLLATDTRQRLVEEIEQWKARDFDKDGKMKVRGKDEIKDVLGRSPDLSDALMMRAFFEYPQHGGATTQSGHTLGQFGNRPLSAMKGKISTPMEYQRTYSRKMGANIPGKDTPKP